MADLSDIMPGNVSPQEQAAAEDPLIGDGTPATAPELDPDSWDAAPPRMPSRKWFAALLVGIGTVATLYITTGGWDAEESIAAVGLTIERGVAWLTPNATQE